MTLETFLTRGWCAFPHDPALAGWVQATLPAARKTAGDPEHAHWLRCGGTWFAGVNVLANDAEGAVEGGPKLSGLAVDFIYEALGLEGFSWDRAQVSVCYPGYPKPMESESEAAHRFRLNRDAAHVDGLMRVGPCRRRRINERHGFLLGIPLVEFSKDASPFVIWEGSHEIIRRAFIPLLEGVAPERWGDIDVTDTYHAARREIFDHCARVEIALRPGEAFLVHRLALHGTAAWASAATAGPDGRMIAYFRPEAGCAGHWISAP